MFQVLLVEDDISIRTGMEEYFKNKESKEFEVETATNGDEALEKIYEKIYDLILLDIMIPGASGYEICKEVRRDSDIPIIFLTALGREENVVLGYDLGCDDYIIKPFSLPVLEKKILALLNRSQGTILSKNIVVGNIELNPRTLQVKVSGEYVVLSPKQYLLLKLLMQNKNEVVSRDKIMIRIWGYDYDGGERVLDNQIKKLRGNLGTEGKRIRTVFGRGYRLEE